jgi:bacteriorhodopsin
MNTVTFFIWVGIVFVALTWLAIFDIARKEFGSLGKKAMWGVIALIPFIGCLIYFAIGFRKGRVPKKMEHSSI